jgi:hypothetical protein
MEEWQQRVLSEFSELCTKIEKLNAWLETHDDALLRIQARAMEAYRAVLSERIDKF